MTKAIPPYMPAAKLVPTGPRMTAVPPVMYSQPLEPHPSMTTSAPQLRTVRVADAIGQLHLLADLEERPCVLEHLRIERVRHLVAALERAVARIVARIGLRQDRVEIEVVEMCGAPAHLCQEIGAADRLGEGAHAERGQDLTHLFGDEAEQIDDLLGRALEFGAQLLV